MIARVVDLRVIQAQRHGVVVGMPRVTAQRIAAIADFLGAASERKDLAFMFDELERHEGADGEFRSIAAGGWHSTGPKAWAP